MVARSVLTEQGVDLAGLDDEVDGVVGGERAEALRDATELELHVGPFRAVGAATGVLGLPTSAATSLASATKGSACSGCRSISFTGGRIYDGPTTGAHALWGSILDAYLHHGGAAGALGMPTTRVHDRTGGGVRASFQHGTIACRHGTCHVTTG